MASNTDILVALIVGLISSISFIVAFYIGLSLGNQVSRGELKPLKTPIKALHDAKESKIAQKEVDKQGSRDRFHPGVHKEKAYEEMKRRRTLMSIMKQRFRCPKCNKTLFRVYDNDTIQYRG